MARYTKMAWMTSVPPRSSQRHPARQTSSHRRKRKTTRELASRWTAWTLRSHSFYLLSIFPRPLLMLRYPLLTPTPCLTTTGTWTGMDRMSPIFSTELFLVCTVHMYVANDFQSDHHQNDRIDTAKSGVI